MLILFEAPLKKSYEKQVDVLNPTERRRRRTSRSLLNFHFTHRKRRPRSGSRAVNRRRRRLFRRRS